MTPAAAAMTTETTQTAIISYAQKTQYAEQYLLTTLRKAKNREIVGKILQSVD